MNINDYKDGTGNVLVSEQLISDLMVDYGTNANGTYMKFKDGVQICYNGFVSASNNSTTGTQITFPASFFDLGYTVIAGARSRVSISLGGSYVVETEPAGLSSCFIKVLTHTPTEVLAPTTTTVYYMAIGRWK